MSEQPNGDPADDDALFDQVTGNAPEPVEDTPEPQVEPEKQPRSEDGRFAAKDPEPEAPPVSEAQTEPVAAKTEGHVPSGRLREEAEARRRAEARVAALEAQFQQFQQQHQPQPQKVEEPEIWQDPNAWVEHKQATLRNTVTATNEFWSEKFAVMQHGAEKVEKAKSAVLEAVQRGELSRDAIRQGFASSRDPIGDIVTWYDRNEAVRDPEGYKARIIEEYKASLQQGQPVQRQPDNVKTLVRVPPSLNRATAVASHEVAGELNDDDLFNAITSRKRA